MVRRPDRLATMVAALIAIASGRAVADDARPTARLEYQVADGIEGCPSDESLRAAIAARLGYDPFQPDAEVLVDARIGRAGKRLVATVAARDPTGASLGRREVESATADCDELGRALALAVSVAIDPFVLTRPAPPPPPEPPPAEEPERAASAGPPPVVVTEPGPRPAPPPPWHGSGVFAGGGAALGAVPSVRPRLALGGALRWRPWAVRLIVDVDAPASVDGASGGVVAVYRAGARVLGCRHHGALIACGGAALATLRTRGSAVDHPMSPTALVPAATLDAGYRFALPGRFALEVHAGGDLVVRTATVALNHEPAFTTARLSPWASLIVHTELP